MTTREAVRRVLRGSAVLTVALFAACAAPATQPVTHPSAAAAPAPCADPSYVELRQQHVDSLSQREWERLQTLDRQCVAARAQAPHNANGMSHGAGHMMGAGIVASVVMVAMMISMW